MRRRRLAHASVVRLSTAPALAARTRTSCCSILLSRPPGTYAGTRGGPDVLRAPSVFATLGLNCDHHQLWSKTQKKLSQGVTNPSSNTHFRHENADFRDERVDLKKNRTFFFIGTHELNFFFHQGTRGDFEFKPTLCESRPAASGQASSLHVARRTRQQLRGARFEVWNAFIHAAHHTRAQVSVKSTPLSVDLCAASWSSSPIRGATDSACLAYADIRQHRFRKRLFARRTWRIVEQAARQQAARVVPQQTHASRTGCSTTDARARDSRYEMLALMLHITHAQNSPNPAGACA